MDYSNYTTALIYANGRKLALNRLSPFGLLPGVNLTWSYYLKVMEQIEQEPMELAGIIRNKK